MSSGPDLHDELQALEQKWEQITSIPDSPRSMMNVIEYSLGSQRKAEVYINRLLKYLLDPEEPHGMGTEFLRATLQGLPAECEFEEDIHDLSDIRVDDQVKLRQVVEEETTSTGLVDLCIEAPNEWYLLIELKFSSKDTQTEFYYNDVTHIEEQPKDEYESGQYYLYIHQHDKPTANEPAFANWTWRAFTADVLDPFITENAPRYPQRTVTQLHDLVDDIQTIAGMSDQQENEQEKIALYLDHYDAIKNVTDTFDDRWEAFTDEWGLRLAETLEDQGIGTYTETSENVITVRLDPEEATRGEWLFRSSSSDWGMIFKHGWWRHTETLEPLDARPDDRNDARIGFHHRLGRNRDLAIGDHTLKLYFRNMGANDQTFIDSFVDHLSNRQEEVTESLPPDIEWTSNKRNMLVATYEIRPDKHEDFFDAYIATLCEAFKAYVVDGDSAIATIGGAYEDAVQEVYGASIDLS